MRPWQLFPAFRSYKQSVFGAASNHSFNPNLFRSASCAASKPATQLATLHKSGNFKRYAPTNLSR